MNSDPSRWPSVTNHLFVFTSRSMIVKFHGTVLFERHPTIYGTKPCKQGPVLFLLQWVREACASDGVPFRARYVSVDSVCQQGQVRAGIGKSNKLRT